MGRAIKNQAVSYTPLYTWEEKTLHKPGAVSDIDTKDDGGAGLCFHRAGAFSIRRQTETFRATCQGKKQIDFVREDVNLLLPHL